MTLRLRVVLDTNALISRLLVPSSVPAWAVQRAISEHIVLASDATIMELADVLSRRKFDPYVSVEDRQRFLRLFGRIVEQATVLHVVRACRDPKDDKFLELAVNGAADVIVTGDADLRALNPFRGIQISSPADFLLKVCAADRPSDDLFGS
nr:putative toxin-antitoxin system toxin component, PIN family [uncultured Rhodopila sp.]